MRGVENKGMVAGLLCVSADEYVPSGEAQTEIQDLVFVFIIRLFSISLLLCYDSVKARFILW